MQASSRRSARTIPAMRILVVEDEAMIADFVQRGLRAEGFNVAWTPDGEEGMRRALAGDVDLVILDLMLPGRDGLSVLDAIRQADATLPVIILSARAEVPDRVAGLDAGATDYLVKPFSFDELLARVRAHLRRSDPGETPIVEAAGIRADLLSRRVACDGRTLALSPREFELLVYLLRHADQVLSRTQILGAVWRYDFDPGTNVVDVYVGYLRRKLAGSGRSRIETVRSVGYRFNSDA